MSSLEGFDLSSYELIIFDWDGTLVDSLGSYSLWDKLYVKRFYGIDLPVEYFENLAKNIKQVTVGSSENAYFRFLDTKYGDGLAPMTVIWDNVYSLAPEIQGKILYRERAPELLALLRSRTTAPIALATNATMRDIQYFSSKESRTAVHIAPLEFFDSIVTSDQVIHPKPHPETFQKIIEQYGVDPRKVLIFEDSAKGVIAARETGADVIAVFGEDEARERAHMVVEDWAEMLFILKKGVR